MMIAGILAGALTVYLHPFWIEVQKISCVEEPANQCSSDIVAELGHARGQLPWHVNTREIEGKILSADRTIKNARISIAVFKRLLSATLTKRAPIAQLSDSDSAPTVLLVDNDGVVFQNSERIADIPVLLVEDASTQLAGQQVSAQLVAMARLAKMVFDREPRISSFHVTPTALEVVFPDDIRVTFSPSRDPGEQVRTLQLVLDEARIEEVTYRTIDLRFVQPIVTK